MIHLLNGNSSSGTTRYTRNSIFSESNKTSYPKRLDQLNYNIQQNY